MRFVLEMECDNAAFEGNDRNYEVANILREAAQKINGGRDSVRLMDHNGNKVGTAEFVED